MRKILSSIFIIAIVSAFVVKMSSAFFSDTETASNNRFTAGSIDLLINGVDNPTGIVNFEDLKPGDDIIQEKTLRVNTNDAYVWLHLKDLVDEQGQQTEPENLEESQNGVKSDIQNYLTYDLSIVRDSQAPEILISFDDNNLLPDVTSCWIPLGVIPGSTNIALNQSFHFDESVSDWAQGDTLTFTEEFYAEQVRNNPNPVGPVTETGRYWDPETKTCIDEDPLLWIIGDIENTQLDNPVDELNWTGVFGVFPTPPAIGDDFTRVITSPIDDSSDLSFPWNTNYSTDYARNIDIDFNYSGTPTNVRLTIGWSPGKSANETKDVYFNAVLIGTLNHFGVATPGWWEQMPRYYDTLDFALSSGSHTIRIEHLQGDGTLWDYIKLERI